MNLKSNINQSGIHPLITLKTEIKIIIINNLYIQQIKELNELKNAQMFKNHENTVLLSQCNN